MAPILRTLIDSIGWRNALRVMSGTSFVVIFAAASLYRPILAPKRHQSGLINRALLRDKKMILLLSSAAIASLGYFVPFVHIVSAFNEGPHTSKVRHASDVGLSATEASLVVSYSGIASTFGRLFFGRIADMKRVDRSLLYTSSMLITGVATILLPFARSYAAFICFAVAFGMFAGVFIAIMPIVVADYIGLSNLSQAMGLMYSIQFIPNLVGPPCAGLVYTATSSYSVVHILSSTDVCRSLSSFPESPLLSATFL